MTSHLIISGGPGHDFAATTASLVDLLTPDGVRSTVFDDPRAAIECLAADASVWDLVTVNALRWRMGADRFTEERERWAFELTDAEAAVVTSFVAGGGGLIALHAAVICFDAHPGWTATVGAAWDWDRSSHPPLGEMSVAATDIGRRHPLTSDIGDFDVVDEAYGFLDVDDDVEPLLTTAHGGAVHPLVWTRDVGAGRVVTDLLGHDGRSLAHPAHRRLLRRAATWAARSATRSASSHEKASP